ncbi:unnamed protein product [Vitrella brassicaformis CCMP3155]|uniref:TLDc domain-containing protein n=1 Tax=Vitrella brassicaformis (strain CCMP3155) TaxID=1169540 RepID=A0A0G4EF49_VITBC|nr:unnamed protein product [Vitrella brassicaformis CCMP3155]|eukprot:CEL94354.1 unnamed protein product [Vitrella brassicaformis CCMP3155]
MARHCRCAALLLVTLSLAWTDSEAQQQQVSLPEGTSLSASEYQGLLDLMGSDNGTDLNSLYRSSVNGTTYGDLLDSVGDAEPLVFVFRKDKYVFGAFINCGLKLPDDPTDSHKYWCDLWHFSLAGHFAQPTKIEFDEDDQWVWVAGREGRVWGANVEIGGPLSESLRLGIDEDSDQPAADIRSCRQRKWHVPEGYVGVSSEPGSAVLGGSENFHADEIEVLRVGGQPVSPPEGTSLSASQYKALLDLMGSNNGTELNVTSLYRSSVNGTTYDDLLDSVGDAEPLVFVIRKDKYVFGAFINCGLKLPDDPTGRHWYDCDLWHFSLAGHFDTPTKLRREQNVRVAGREGSAWGANVKIGGALYLGDDENSGRPAADIRSCYQYTHSDDVPEGYTGEYHGGGAVLGGSDFFHADKMEVLQVDGYDGGWVSPPNGTSLSGFEYDGLLDLMGNDNGTELTSLYRTSVYGTTYDDLLDSVGDAEPLVFVIRKDKYVFGAFINCGLQLTDNSTRLHKYECDLWHFSLAGHFAKPTKIDVDEDKQWVGVTGREGSAGICVQITDSDDVPAGYTGERDWNGDAHLGSYKSDFNADEIEVLHVVGNKYEGLLDLMGTDNVTSLYRSSVHGTTYDDLLNSVGDAEPLVFVIRKDKYVFGVHINCGLELPDDPTDYNDYECDVRWFSLAGHFAKPTKIDAREMYQGVDVMVAGHSAGGVSVMIGGYRRLVHYQQLYACGLYGGVERRCSAGRVV